MTYELTFTATVQSYEDANFPLDDAPEDIILTLIEENYNIPKDCIDDWEVR